MSILNPTKVEQKESQALVQMLMTDDYDAFKVLPYNRALEEKQVLRLMDVLSKEPDALKYRPLLVNNHMQVIDGQHRLEAAKRLGLPIYYMIGNNLGLPQTIEMNAIAKHWTILDYARSWAGQGNTHYQLYLDIRDQYKGLNDKILHSYLLGRSAFQTSQQFKEGKFVIKDSMETIEERIGMWDELQAALPKIQHKRSSIAVPFLAMMQRDDYDHARMLRKLSYNAGKYFTYLFPSAVEATRALEDAYNENSKAEDRIRIY